MSSGLALLENLHHQGGLGFGPEMAWGIIADCRSHMRRDCIPSLGEFAQFPFVIFSPARAGLEQPRVNTLLVGLIEMRDGPHRLHRAVVPEIAEGLSLL